MAAHGDARHADAHGGNTEARREHVDEQADIRCGAKHVAVHIRSVARAPIAVSLRIHQAAPMIALLHRDRDEPECRQVAALAVHIRQAAAATVRDEDHRCAHMRLRPEQRDFHSGDTRRLHCDHVFFLRKKEFVLNHEDTKGFVCYVSLADAGAGRVFPQQAHKEVVIFQRDAGRGLVVYRGNVVAAAHGREQALELGAYAPLRPGA